LQLVGSDLPGTHDLDLDWEPPLATLYRDLLYFRHLFHRKATAFPTEAAVLDAAEWDVRLVCDGAVVVVRQSLGPTFSTVSTLLDTSKQRLRDRCDEIVYRKIPDLYSLG
jgi:hypothetical protein